MGMTRLMIRLNEAERTALSRAAWAQRRQARELAEVLLRRWLVKHGYLDDPTAAGGLRNARKDTGSAEVLADRGATGR